MCKKYFCIIILILKIFISDSKKRFQKFELNKQKKIFCSMLDLNQMYVSYSEMGDKSTIFQGGSEIN